MNTQTLTSEHILLSFLDLTAMLRAVNGISALPNKVLTTTPARRVFSNSVCRFEEAKASKGIPLALDLGGIQIPKPGQSMSSHYSLWASFAKLCTRCSLSGGSITG